MIQQKSTSADTQGGRSTTWATLATVWAAVTPTATTERIDAEALGSHGRYQVEIRYRADVTPAMRISWTPYLGSAKTLQIHGVQPVSRDRLRLDCGEVI